MLSKQYGICFIVVLINTCANLNVEGAKEAEFNIIRHEHGIDYLQYIGLIPRSVKCLKWGVRTTHFQSFKLEIVCLQELAEHEGDCPIWQDCIWRPYYNKIGYFSYTCSSDNDCSNFCKCCYSPCSGIFTCRPAINRASTTPVIRTTTEGNIKSTTSYTTATTMPLPASTTTAERTTTTPDIGSPNYDDPTTETSKVDEELPIELDYDDNSIESSVEKAPPPGPNILEEATSDYDDSSIQIDDVPSKEDDADSPNIIVTDSVPQVGNEESKVRETTPEPSLVRPTRPESIPEDDEGGSGGSGNYERPEFVGQDRNVFRNEDDDEDMVSGSGGV